MFMRLEQEISTIPVDQENIAIGQIIDGLNISENVKDVLRGVKQYFTPVVLEYVDENRYVVSKSTSYLIIDNDKIAYGLHGDDAGMWLVRVRELSGTEEGKAFAQERKSLIKNKIIIPLAKAQRMSGDFLATEVGGGKLPTPGYLQNLLPDRSLVFGFDYKQTPYKKISASSYETLGWIDVSAQKGLSLFAVMNIEELDPDLDGIFYDFGRAVMPQPFIADTVLQALIERIDWTQSDARCVIYLDPFFTEGILNLPEAVGMSPAEIEIYNRSVILHNLTVEKMRVDGAWETQNDLIKSLKENPIVITLLGKKLRIRVIYPTRVQINDPNHAGITDPDTKYLGAFDTAFVEDGFDSIPIPTIIISPDTGSDDTNIPDRVDVSEIDLRSLLPPALLAALGVSLGLLGGRHRGKGTGGQPLPAV